MTSFTAPWKPAFAGACLLGSLAAPAGAQPQWQDLPELERAAESYARAHVQQQPGRIEVSAGALDPRTRLPRCEQLQAFLPPNARLWGTSNVGLRCVQPSAWSMFVPVTVRVHAEVVVTSRPVGRGQALGDADLALRTLDLTQQPLGLITNTRAAAGKVSVAALPAGAALRPDMLRAPVAVFQGQNVKLLFQGDGFRVSSEGRSLSNASIGEPAQVRTASGKVVKGTVQAPGVVEVR
jgi:flagellar basal body P-ring formation protein FlgA